MTGVCLRTLDDSWIGRLADTATRHAAPSETMPTSEAQEWNPQVTAAFHEYHRRRSALASLRTYVIAIDTTVLGAVRLDDVDHLDEGTFETDMWLARTARGKYLASQALSLTLTRAATLGAQCVVARAGFDNLAAHAAMRRIGAYLKLEDTGIRAEFILAECLRTTATPIPQPA